MTCTKFMWFGVDIEDGTVRFVFLVWCDVLYRGCRFLLRTSFAHGTVLLSYRELYRYILRGQVSNI